MLLPVACFTAHVRRGKAVLSCDLQAEECVDLVSVGTLAHKFHVRQQGFEFSCFDEMLTQTFVDPRLLLYLNKYSF